MAENKAPAFWRAVLAEFLGMAIFVFIGISAAIGNPNNGRPDRELKVALAFGLAIATLAQCVGHVNGAHLNPAVTVGFLVSCQMSVCRAVLYILAQMLGAVAGSAVVYCIKPRTTDSVGLNKLNEIGPVQGLAAEFVLTLQLVLCVLAVKDHRRDASAFAPLAIGSSVVVGHLAGISYTGCSINPARSFGPALIQASFNHQWVFWVAPLSAGVAAGVLYDNLLCLRSEPLCMRAQVLWGCEDCEVDAGAAEIQQALLADCQDAVESKCRL